MKRISTKDKCAFQIEKKRISEQNGTLEISVEDNMFVAEGVIPME